jgi:predicted enzyme related to lactoylglutathione lyase
MHGPKFVDDSVSKQTMFVAVESIDDYISKAQEMGAKVVKNKREIDAGYYAVMEDTQKNTFGLWQDK